eukprot:4293717-Amphidinium_carterae.2
MLQSCRRSDDELLDCGLEKMVKKDLNNAGRWDPSLLQKCPSILALSTGSLHGDVVSGDVLNRRSVPLMIIRLLAGTVDIVVLESKIDGPLGQLETEVCRDACLKGCVAKDWSSEGLTLNGTTIDLEAAFRQLQLPLPRASAPQRHCVTTRQKPKHHAPYA